MKNTIILSILTLLSALFSCKSDPLQKAAVKETTLGDTIHKRENVSKPPLDSNSSVKTLPIKKTITPDWDSILDTMAQKMWSAYTGTSTLPFSVKAKENGMSRPMPIASYKPSDKSITFNTTVLEILKKEFPKNWQLRLASILGHEIWHYVQKLDYTTEFANSSEMSDTGPLLKTEDAADINGNFLAYLAGYDTRSLFPETIERLYEKCAIPKVKSNRYRSLADRKNSAEAAMEKLNGLIHLFNAGLYSSLLGKYDMARNAYKAILSVGYSGAEIYYNQGLNDLFEALDGPHKDYKYIWPLVIEDGSRLKAQVERERGALATPKEDLITNAILNFRKTLRVNPAYDQAILHTLIAHALNGKRTDFDDYYHSIVNSVKYTNNSFQQQTDLIFVLFNLQFSEEQTQKDEAQNRLRELSQSNFSRIQQLAKWNLSIATGRTIEKQGFDTNPGISAAIQGEKFSWKFREKFQPITLFWTPVASQAMWVKLEIKEKSIILSSKQIEYLDALRITEQQTIPSVSTNIDDIYILNKKNTLLIIQNQKKQAYIITMKE